MTAQLDGLYYIRYVEQEDSTSMYIGQFIGFVSTNFLLVQPYCRSDERGFHPFEGMKIMGIPHFEDCLCFKTLEEAIEEFEFAMEPNDEDQCDGI